MRYIRKYNEQPKPVKWKYCDLSRLITPDSIVTLCRGIGGLNLEALGIPSERDYVAMYVKATGRDPTAHWNYYLAYNLFRMSAILHGIAQRAVTGSASASDAVETGSKAQPLAELGWECALSYQAGETGTETIGPRERQSSARCARLGNTDSARLKSLLQIREHAAKSRVV